MEVGSEKIADICIIAEGSYPYYSGGVAQWIHELITEHKEKTFHILTLMPPNPDLTFRYQFPPNVMGHTVFIIQDLPDGAHESHTPKETWDIINPTLKGVMTSKKFEDFAPLLAFIQKYRNILGKRILLESWQAWEFFLKIYEETIPSGPFKAYFATIFVLTRSLFSILLPSLPQAKLYHAVCTGYAGFLLYRAKQEYGAPCILTEHGVYTNERRIEIATEDWIAEMGSLDLDLENKRKSLKDFWLNAFFSMAHICYISCDEVISTFSGNQEIQKEGGADARKMRAISHGINLQDYASITRKQNLIPQVVAFVGRVVPIKDVQTLIRAFYNVKKKLPKTLFYILGPTNEDPEYFQKCASLVKSLDLQNEVQFFGKVNLKDYLSKIDLLVLTSISETQPLVILEGGSIGIPCIATNVGACKELIEGSQYESPPLGSGGIVTPLANPRATSDAIIQLLTDHNFYEKCSHAIAQRIRLYYQFSEQHAEYRKIYHRLIKN